MPITPNCINYCGDTLDDHELILCDDYLLGSISGIILLECGHQLEDPSNAELINVEIAAGRAHLINNVKLSIDGASAIKGEKPVGGAPQMLVNYDRKGTYIDGNVTASNVALYDKIFGGYTIGGVIVYEKGSEKATSGAQVTWINETVVFTGSRIIPVSDGEVQTFTGEMTWRSKLNGDIYPAPVGIF